ncbi:replication-relaxation family protein [Amycolatopsis sp. NPDC058986]|uniref:replication-relaxation family protein n=1 Tax=unclassified Amycolatopsis TaxID=2618356 RepID=UPI0036708A24
MVELFGQHALDVVETGRAFLDTARRHGHDCGPLAWTPEVAHRYRDQRVHGGANRDVLVADAVLHYTLVEPSGRRSQRTFFIELDRATMPVARLAAKLRNYVRYHDYVPQYPGATGRPAWQERYPRFPRVLLVLSGAAEHVLEQRLVDLRAHAQADSAMALAGDRVRMLATSLHRLRTGGPLAPIAVSLLGTDTTPISPFTRLTTGTS